VARSYNLHNCPTHLGTTHDKCAVYSWNKGVHEACQIRELLLTEKYGKNTLTENMVEIKK